MSYVNIRREGGVIRAFAWVLHWTSGAPLFSERHGYRTPFLRALGYRFFFRRDRPLSDCGSNER